jgi:hypothetical protein
MDFRGILVSLWSMLLAFPNITPIIVAFAYEIFTGAVRPQLELFSNIALWLGKLIHVSPTVEEYGVERNLNVKIENRPFLVVFRRPIPCRPQMVLYTIQDGVRQENGERFDVAFLGKEKGDKVDLDVGIENTVRLITSSPSGLPKMRICSVPPNGSPIYHGEYEIRLVLSWGIGSRSYMIGRYRLPDLTKL